MPIPKSYFCNFLQEMNGFQDNFSHWSFLPGMFYNESNAWWQKGLARPTPHEGVDFCGYMNLAGSTFSLNTKTKIPAMFDGEVTKIFDDFLGRSILVGHELFEKKKRFYSLYAHTRPNKNCRIGLQVKAGQIIAKVAPSNAKKIPPHLHLTTLLINEPFPDTLNWETINTLPEISLRDPVKFIDLDIWYVYIVRCADGSLYSGITTDLSRRLTEHNAEKGGARYTRARQPVTLHYYETSKNRSTAAKRESALKRMNHAQKQKLSHASDR